MPLIGIIKEIRKSLICPICKKNYLNYEGGKYLCIECGTIESVDE